MNLIPGSGRSPGGGSGNQSSVLTREVPWTEEPGGLQSTGLQGAGKTEATEHSTYTRRLTSCHTAHGARSALRDDPRGETVPKGGSLCCTPEANTAFSNSTPIKTNKKLGASLGAQTVKHVPAMRETRVRSLGREDPLEKEMATHSSTLAWKIPWTEEPGGLQSIGSQRVGHD